jgi:hypothetical protein
MVEQNFKKAVRNPASSKQIQLRSKSNDLGAIAKREAPLCVNGTSARLGAAGCCRSRADRLDAVYLRAAQAYMLISMPTGTSTTFGVFQVIESLPSSLARGPHRDRT